MGFKEDMATFQTKFRDLEREYEQWFSGALRTPPLNTQSICERIVNQYSRNPSKNLSEQTIFSMHQAKFNTYMEMWNRRMRLKEEGKLPTGREERSKRVVASPQRSQGGESGSADPYKKVFDNYVTAKRQAGESTETLNYDSFKNALKKQAAELRSSRGIQNVNFGVSLKDGKVSVVARSKKT